jgi:hypothetical protein
LACIGIELELVSFFRDVSMVHHGHGLLS